MKTNKNIDRLFQEKLKDMEITPPDIVWDNIEKAIIKKKKRRVIPLWLRYGAAAAILLLMTLGVVNYFYSSSEIEVIENSIVDSDVENTPIINEKTIEKPIENIIEETIVIDNNTKGSSNADLNIKENTINESVVVETKNNADTKVNVNQKNDNTIIESVAIDAKNENKADIKVNLNQKNNLNTLPNIKENPIANVPQKELSVTENKNSVANNAISNDTTISPNQNTLEENLIAEVETSANDSESEKKEETLITSIDEDFLKENEIDTKKWLVASVVAPIYLNSFNSMESSPIAPQFNNNQKEANTTFSYGLKVGYQLNKKFTLQSGVSIINLSYTTNDVNISSSLNNTQSLNIIIQSSAANVMLTSTAFDGNLSNSPTTDIKEVLSSSTESGALNQEFGYVEIPLEIKYNLINGKFGVNLIGGFSTLLLNNNKISAVSENLTTNIGEASNINSVNFTGNFGVDLDYKINKNIFINVAPTIKIQTNTFSENSQGFNPYFFGIYTGLNYKF